MRLQAALSPALHRFVERLIGAADPHSIGAGEIRLLPLQGCPREQSAEYPRAQSNEPALIIG
jgi:hypothetical protein